MDNSASTQDLFTRLEAIVARRDAAADAFDIFKQDAMTHLTEEGAAGEPTADEAADVAAGAIDTYSAEADALMAAATDDELSVAYAKTHGLADRSIARTLELEIGRRGLDG